MKWQYLARVAHFLHRDTIDEIIDVRQRDLNHAAVVFRKKRPDFKAAP